MPKIIEIGSHKLIAKTKRVSFFETQCTCRQCGHWTRLYRDYVHYLQLYQSPQPIFVLSVTDSDILSGLPSCLLPVPYGIYLLLLLCKNTEQFLYGSTVPAQSYTGGRVLFLCATQCGSVRPSVGP